MEVRPRQSGDVSISRSDSEHASCRLERLIGGFKIPSLYLIEKE